MVFLKFLKSYVVIVDMNDIGVGYFLGDVLFETGEQGGFTATPYAGDDLNIGRADNFYESFEIISFDYFHKFLSGFIIACISQND